MKALLRRLGAILVALAALVVGVASPAFADDVTNNLDVSVDSQLEKFTMAPNLVPGVWNGVGFSMKVVPTSDDGVTGCNFASGTSLIIKLESTNADIVSAGPNFLTFTDCNQAKNFTVTPGALSGEATIFATVYSNDTGASFNLASASFVIVVNRPPVVSITGVEAEASYVEGSIPEGTCHISDYEDGVDFTQPAQTVRFPSLPGRELATCYYQDSAGTIKNVGVWYNVAPPSDTTPPVLNPTISDSTLYVGDEATVTPNASDPESGIESQSCGAVDTSSPGTRSVTCTATNGAGLTAEATLEYTVQSLYPTDGSVTYNGEPANATLEPISSDPSNLSVFKKNSTVPIKFHLVDNAGTLITDPSVIDGLRYVSRTALATGEPVDEPFIDDPVSRTFRFDAESGQFVYNLSTKKLEGGYAYTYAVDIGPESIYVTFGVK